MKTKKTNFQSLRSCKFSNLSQYPISHQSALNEMQFRFYFFILPSLCQQFFITIAKCLQCLNRKSLYFVWYHQPKVLKTEYEKTEVTKIN